MSLRTKCPHCEREALVAADALGKSIRCKGCSKAFAVRAMAPAGVAAKAGSDHEMRAAVRAGQPTPARTRGRPGDDDSHDRPHRREEAGESKSTLWIGLGAIGAVTVIASVLTFVLIVNRHPPVVIQVPPPPVKAPVEAPIAKVPPKVEPPAPAPKVEPGPKTEPPKVEPPPNAKVGDPAGFYGDQGGEPTAPAVFAPFTQLRARRVDSFYDIDNLRVVAQGDNPRGAVTAQFKITKRSTYPATHLILRYENGRTDTIGFGSILEKDSGTIRVNRDPKSPTPYPENLECYLVRAETSYGNPVPAFMVSNVIRIGEPGQPTRPRDWTPQEIARMSKESPIGLKENALAGVGVDTEFAGNSPGGIPRRFVDPKAPLIGLEYRPGLWMGEMCLGSVRPIYRQDQNRLLPSASVAREGYAVSGLEAQFRINLDALKLHFRKIRPDGSLDPNDAYEGEWFGFPDPAAQRKTLGDTGARVIGIHCRAGSVVDAMALVLDR